MSFIIRFILWLFGMGSSSEEDELTDDQKDDLDKGGEEWPG